MIFPFGRFRRPSNIMWSFRASASGRTTPTRVLSSPRSKSSAILPSRSGPAAVDHLTQREGAVCQHGGNVGAAGHRLFSEWSGDELAPPSSRFCCAIAIQPSEGALISTYRSDNDARSFLSRMDADPDPARRSELPRPHTTLTDVV